MSFPGKISVIIPVFNSEKFLKQSLDSVLQQTYSNIEVICIDDGSTDRSPAILKQYSDKVTILTQKNQGLASALNTGIDEMNGIWFKWFSPDDMMYPQTIENLVNEARKFSENTIIYSNWDIIDENSNKIRNFSESNYNDLSVFEFNVRLLDGQQINVNTTLIPKSLLTKGFRMNTSIDPALVDYDFFLRTGLLYNTKFQLIEKNLIKYRIHKSQLSHQNIIKSLENLKLVKDVIISELDSKTKQKYIISLEKFTQNKSISKKTMEIILQLTSSLLPNSVTDKILIFYLNKIRRTR